MKGIINIILISAASMFLLSCSREDSFDAPMNESIVLDLSSGLTKATVKEDNITESFVNHIDVLIFTDSGGSPDMKKYHGRYVINNAPQLTLDAKRSSFDSGVPYHVYLVANSNLPASDFAAVSDFGGLVEMKQTDEYLHLTGINVGTSSNIPEYFLMDAKATDAPAGTNTLIVLNNGNVADNTEIHANLRRAAAKVYIRMIAGEDVRFADFDQTAGGELISEGGLYYIQNLPTQAFILSESKDDDMINSDVVALKNTEWSYDGHFKWNPEIDNKNASLVTYVYPNSWTTTDIMNNETCVIVNLPLVYAPEGEEPQECHNSWYKIHMTGEKVLRRNNYYEVEVTVNRPGATSETNPEHISGVHYSVKDWYDVPVNVGGDDKPSYLQLNQQHLDMYNVNTDDSSMEFSSSSPIQSITLDKAYYVNYLGQEVDVEDVNKNVYNAIEATADAGVLNGNITIFSPFVKGDGFDDSHGNAIRYMTFTVTNQDGKKQTFTVNQYPTLYITHEMGKYSYRSDFGGTNYEDGPGNPNRAGVSWTGSGWNYDSRASSSVFFGSKVALNRYGSYTINYAYFNSSSSTSANTSSQFMGLNNPRMYHIHVTATSEKYTVARPRLDDDGYTESSAENAMLVSPSFMAASQLGATQQLTGGVDQAKAHCEQYIEVTEDGVEYDDWRLPTAAEIQIIIDHQEKSDAMATILTEGAYYCAYNPQTGGYTKETGKSSYTIPVRCVRDAY